MPKYKYLLLLSLIGILIFFPIFTTGFLFDDIQQIANNKLVHDQKNVFKFLTSGIAAPDGKKGQLNYFYRPLPFMLFTLIYEYGNGNPTYFHIIQLLLFIMTAWLVLIFFAKFFSHGLSFILALTFLVHPINQTHAAYIAVYFDIFSFFFGMLALLTITSTLTMWRKTIISNILLLFSLLSKEAGILFLPIIILYGNLFSKLKIKIYLPVVLLTLSIFAWLRINAYPNHFLTYHSSYPLEQPLLDRIRMLPTLMFYYYKEFFIPNLAGPTIEEITIHPPHFSIIVAMHISLLIGAAAYTFFLKNTIPKL